MDESFFRAYYQAYNTADPARLRPFLADGVVLESAAGVQEGAEAYLGTYQWITGRFIDEMTPTRIELTGDGAVVHIHDRFTAKADVPEFLGRSFRTGEVMEMDIVGTYRVRDGRITHISIAMA
jgi:ketosteroid isomerase-like protein